MGSRGLGPGVEWVGCGWRRRAGLGKRQQPGGWCLLWVLSGWGRGGAGEPACHRRAGRCRLPCSSPAASRLRPACWHSLQPSPTDTYICPHHPPHSLTHQHTHTCTHMPAGNEKALATVTAIIDGMGSIGAAIGPMLTGYISGGRAGCQFFLFYEVHAVPLPPPLGETLQNLACISGVLGGGGPGASLGSGGCGAAFCGVWGLAPSVAHPWLIRKGPPRRPSLPPALQSCPAASTMCFTCCTARPRRQVCWVCAVCCVCVCVVYLCVCMVCVCVDGLHRFALSPSHIMAGLVTQPTAGCASRSLVAPPWRLPCPHPPLLPNCLPLSPVSAPRRPAADGAGVEGGG